MDSDVVAVGTPIGTLHVRGHDLRIGGSNQAQFFQRSQGVADRSLGQPGVPGQPRQRGEGVATIRISVVGQADQHHR